MKTERGWGPAAMKTTKKTSAVKKKIRQKILAFNTFNRRLFTNKATQLPQL